MTADAALDFLEFVEERHRIWERRQVDGTIATDNPILACHKFTNVYRLLDPGSQFVINELHNPELSPRDNLMRFFLYRHTGRVETWEFMQVMMGDYPTFDTLDEALSVLQTYRGAGVTKTIQEKSHAGTPHKIERTKTNFSRPVFTGAYLVFPQSDTPGTDKLESIFNLTKRLFDPVSGTVDLHTFTHPATQADRFRELRQNKGVADFMSMQVLTDWGYTTEFREDEFVVCGPGAKKGADALGYRDAARGHRWALDAVRGLGLELYGRSPSWMDVQNCLCEFSKYVRFAASGKSGVRYTPAHPGPQPIPTIPRKW